MLSNTQLLEAKDNLFHSLFNLFQILRDVFFREAKRSTCAITGQPFTPNFTHHCRAGNTTAKLPDIVNGVLRSLALQRRASLDLLGYRLFHTFGGVGAPCFLKPPLQRGEKRSDLRSEWELILLTRISRGRLHFRKRRTVSKLFGRYVFPFEILFLLLHRWGVFGLWHDLLG